MIVWLVLIVIFPLYATNGLRFGTLQDPDDYLYLIQAMDWLNGQGWFDLIQHRMNPPEGTYVHFSHILSAFYGVLIFMLRPFVGYLRAGMIVAAVIPPILFALFLCTTQWAARTLINREWTGIAAYIILFSLVTLSQFVPGHIDHHGLEILLAMAAYGCLARMTLQPTEFRWAVLGGCVLAFALVIGLEILPVLILFAGWAGLQAVVNGGLAARNGFVFTLSLFFSSAVFLCMTRPANIILDADVRVYSVVYVILAGGIAIVFAGVAAAAQTSKVFLRYLAGVGLALTIGLCFLHLFPAMQAGPYGGVDPLVVKLIVDDEPESQPAIHLHKQKIRISEIVTFLWPLVSLIVSLALLFRTKDTPRRWLWGLFALVLSCSGVLGAFYQSRFLTYTYSFAVIPLSYAIWCDWLALANARSMSRVLSIARLAIILLIGPLSLLLAPPNMDDDDNSRTTFHQSTASNSPRALGCGSRALAHILNDPGTYGDHPRLIINSFNDGTEILFRTPHSILAAPFHMDGSGNVDVLRFFTTHDPAEAEAIARRRGAELVAFCALPRPLTIYLPDEKSVTSDSTPNFLQQLIGGRIPSWLKPVQSPSLGDMMLFEILPRPPNTTKM